MPNQETIGDTVHVQTADHPPRKDSPLYTITRKWLMGAVRGGCQICGGPADLSHPGVPADAKGLQDHHGGGIYLKGVLVALNLFPLEWSQGFGASPSVVGGYVGLLNEVLKILGEPTYDKPITNIDEVMAYVDSKYNANVKFCAPHHVGHQTQHTPDIWGHEAVGIHNIPGPIFWGQATCDWKRFDMWGGTTGTISVAPHATIPGAVTVMHVDPAHPVLHQSGRRLQFGDVLPPTHPHSRAAIRSNA